MKKYALLASLCLLLFATACTKELLEIEITEKEVMSSDKDKNKPDPKWDTHSKVIDSLQRPLMEITLEP